MGCQWYQLDHMQIICTSLQTDDHTSISLLNFLLAGCSSACQTNSVKNTHAHTHAHTQTHTHMTILCLCGFCPGQPGWANTIRNIHPLTSIMVISHPLSASSIYYDPWHPLCSIYMPDSLFPQSLSKFSLVYLPAWHLPLHTPYISSSNHCPLFAAHAHSITTCFAVVPRLCHLILISLSTLYLELYLVASCHTSI